ncbi:MAG: dihydropteroate synthase [Nitrospirota bacterium]|jgi:cobalamin-dependent methionine synthase I
MRIIGENINGTIPRIRDLILEHDGKALVDLAVRQVEAGADVVDINVGTGEGTAEDEIQDIQWLVGLVKEATGAGLCIDSADVRVLRAGLEAGGESAALVNSVKATEENMAEVMPLVGEAGLPVVALAMDASGIPRDAASRLRACEKLLRGAEEHGVPAGNIYFDPLVMPVSTDITGGKTTLETLAGIKREFPGARTVLALSNVSFGLPRRGLVNQAMLHMAQYLEVDALIVNPLQGDLMLSVQAGEALLGRDRHCRRYARAARRAAERREKVHG